MIIKFKNSDERKKHPLVGLIPDDVWNRYFYREIDDRLLDIMISKPEELLKKYMTSAMIFLAVVQKKKYLLP